MYQPAEILEFISGHVVLVVALGGGALLCNFVFFGEAARLGFRDRCAPMALWGTAMFLPHDGNYLLDYDRWFHQYDHWFPKLFWVGLVITFSFELVFLGQIIRFGRQEFAPRLSQRAWTGYCLAGVLAGTIGWAIVKANLNDDLYLLSFMVTILLCGPSCLPLMVRRASRRGFSVPQLAAFTLMAAFFTVITVLMGAPFRTPLWIGLSLAAVGYGLVMLRTVSILPAYRAAPARSPGALEPTPN